MKENFFSIGEISKTKGITIKALRFYEKIGLLKPCYTDPITKYRYYSLDQSMQLDIIKASRSMGMSPKDIKVILEKKDNSILLDFLEKQKESAIRKISDMKKTVSTMDAFLKIIQTSGLSVLNQDIYFKELPERRIVTKELGNQINEASIHLEFAKFCKLIEDNKLLNTFESGFFFVPYESNQYIPTRLFSAVAIDDASNTSILSSIPAGHFLCICFNKHTEQEQIFKLSSYLAQNNIEPKIFLQVFLMNDFFKSDLRYTEIQVLI